LNFSCKSVFVFFVGVPNASVVTIPQGFLLLRLLPQNLPFLWLRFDPASKNTSQSVAATFPLAFSSNSILSFGFPTDIGCSPFQGSLSPNCLTPLALVQLHSFPKPTNKLIKCFFRVDLSNELLIIQFVFSHRPSPPSYTLPKFPFFRTSRNLFPHRCCVSSILRNRPLPFPLVRWYDWSSFFKLSSSWFPLDELARIHQTWFFLFTPRTFPQRVSFAT